MNTGQTEEGGRARSAVFNIRDAETHEQMSTRSSSLLLMEPIRLFGASKFRLIRAQNG